MKIDTKVAKSITITGPALSAACFVPAGLAALPGREDATCRCARSRNKAKVRLGCNVPAACRQARARRRLGSITCAACRRACARRRQGQLRRRVRPARGGHLQEQWRGQCQARHPAPSKKWLCQTDCAESVGSYLDKVCVTSGQTCTSGHIKTVCVCQELFRKMCVSGIIRTICVSSGQYASVKLTAQTPSGLIWTRCVCVCMCVCVCVCVCVCWGGKGVHAACKP